MVAEGRRTRSLRAFFSSSWVVDSILLLIMSGFGIYIISGIFNPGLLYQWDLSQHFVESYFDATVLLPQYHQLIGWNPYYYLGYPQGQFDPPLGYVVYAIMYYALSWLLSALTIYKLMIALFFILPAVSLYFAARLFGLSRLSGFFAGILALGTSGGFEQGGPVDMMVYGMYEFAAAVALIPLILAIYHRAFEKRSWHLLLLTAFLAALDFLLHTIAGVFLILVLTVYTIFCIGRITIFGRQKFGFLKVSAKFLIVIAIVFGLCAFWIVPAVANQSFYASQNSLVTELGNFGTTYNDIVNGLVFGQTTIPYSTSLLPNLHPAIVTSLYSADQAPLHFSSLLYSQVLFFLSCAGIILAFFRKQFRLPVIVALVLIGIFFFISLGPTYYESLWHSKFFQLLDLRPARAAAPARIFLLMFAGIGIGESISMVSRGLSKWKIPAIRIVKVATIILILLFAFSLVSNSISLVSQLKLGSTTSDISSASSLNNVFLWIQQNVPNTSRVAYEEYPSADQHLMSVSPYFTGREAIGSEYGFWWVGADASTETTAVLSEVGYYGDYNVVNTLEGLNVGYVVAWNSETKLVLQQDGEFNLVYQSGIFDVFQIDDFAPSFVQIQNGTGIANVTSFQPESITVHVANATPGSSLLVRVEYYTDWTAFSSLGEQLKVSPVNVSLPLTSVVYMSVPLTSSGSYNVTFQYTLQKSDMVGQAVSYFSIFVWGIAIFLSLESRYSFLVSDYLAKNGRKASNLVRQSPRRIRSFAKSLVAHSSTKVPSDVAIREASGN